MDATLADVHLLTSKARPFELSQMRQAVIVWIPCYQTQDPNLQ